MKTEEKRVSRMLNGVLERHQRRTLSEWSFDVPPWVPGPSPLEMKRWLDAEQTRVDVWKWMQRRFK